VFLDAAATIEKALDLIREAARGGRHVKSAIGYKLTSNYR